MSIKVILLTVYLMSEQLGKLKISILLLDYEDLTLVKFNQSTRVHLVLVHLVLEFI